MSPFFNLGTSQMSWEIQNKGLQTISRWYDSVQDFVNSRINAKIKQNYEVHYNMNHVKLFFVFFKSNLSWYVLGAHNNYIWKW
jgi:hypothetical protein